MFNLITLIREHMRKAAIQKNAQKVLSRHELAGLKSLGAFHGARARRLITSASCSERHHYKILSELQQRVRVLRDPRVGQG